MAQEKKTPKLLKFHLLQGYNYVYSCAYFAYLAIQGSEAQPKFFSRLWMSMEDPPLNPLEGTLLAMFWMSVFCIGLGYLSLPKHLESVYGSFFTLLIGGPLSFKQVMFTPAQYPLILLIIPVDFGGIIYKTYLFMKESSVIPQKARKLLRDVSEQKGRSAMFKLLELEAYAFMAYMYYLAFFKCTSCLLPGYEGPRVKPFSKMFFVVQALVFQFTVPALRQGKWVIYKVLTANKCIVASFLIKGIFFDRVIPKEMYLWVLLPYMVTLTVELELMSLRAIFDRVQKTKSD